MKTRVFTSGKDGYHTYRIPALIGTPEGNLLAFCEGRRNNARDQGDLDLLVKRSEDGGRTWSDQQLVYGEPGEITIGNPCPVLDEQTGTLWLPFCRNNGEVLITHSDDDGRSWSDPIEITAEVKKADWIWYATGPGVGIQLRRGPHRGRLVIPCDHRGPAGNDAHVIYSDDGGETWRRGEPVEAGSNECQVAERSDGTLVLNLRMQTHSQGYRGVAESRDGGLTWSGFRHDRNLPCPKCQASLIRCGPEDGNRLLFSNPAAPEPPKPEPGTRSNLTVRRSEDGGQTWSVVKELHAGPAAYSCLTVFSDGSAACLYEAGGDSPYEHLVFERFSVD